MRYDVKKGKVMINVNESLKGVIAPVITPIDAKEHVDRSAFRAVIRRCIDAGVDGIFAGGSAGMGPLLTDDQWAIAMETAWNEVGGSCMLLGGAIETSTSRAVERIKVLQDIGFRRVAVTPTYYVTMSEESEFLQHFEKCREASDMEMVVYNIPSCTYTNIPLTVLDEMASQGWFKTVKESSGDRNYFRSLIQIADRHGLNVLQGNEPDIEWGLAEGAAGIVPVCANYEPETFLAAYESARSNNCKLLSAAQKRINYIRDQLLVKSENWISGIMYGVSTLGIGSGHAVLPLCALSKESRDRISLLETLDVRKEAVYETE